MSAVNKFCFRQRLRAVEPVSDRLSERLNGYEGRSKTGPTPNRAGLIFAGAVLALAPLIRAEVLIERCMLPDAHAGSFAFGLPGGVNFCYDPVRGGVNYAWAGGFLDLAGVRPINKLITAAKPLGPVVFRETGDAPLRRSDPRRTPVVEFRGYTLRDASVELRYTLDGVLVREEISALPAGAGLRRRFTFDAAGADSQWWRVMPGRVPEPFARDGSGAFVLEHKFRSATR